ncbi:DUF1471 domain-containing protein [Salmonella enterica]|nr:DUF1471 domain-containing protein [Salmonella enterica subsp. enterica serovar Kiambu]EHF0053365.1 DUF1471 domain-containing protein [Salmonella enterica]ELE4479445.1 DUF1471 domain-containing protein [Salmonella enterica]ELZ5129074.1 DUF1471 domain-containing protein [Salmonella enterica]
MNMLKTTLLMTDLLNAPATFSVLAQQPGKAAFASVSAITEAPFVVDDAIEKLAQEKNVTPWGITSIRIDSNTHATAILYK